MYSSTCCKTAAYTKSDPALTTKPLNPSIQNQNNNSKLSFCLFFCCFCLQIYSTRENATTTTKTRLFAYLWIPGHETVKIVSSSPGFQRLGWVWSLTTMRGISLCVVGSRTPKQGPDDQTNRCKLACGKCKVCMKNMRQSSLQRQSSP